jgi:hypothetical protein
MSAVTEPIAKNLGQLPYDMLGIIVSMSGAPTIWARVCKAFNHLTVQCVAYKTLLAAYERYPLLKAVAAAKFTELKKSFGHAPNEAQLVMAVYHQMTMDGDGFEGPRYIPLPDAPLGRLYPEWLLGVSKTLDIQRIFENIAQIDRPIDKMFRHLKKALLDLAQPGQPGQRNCVQLSQNIYLWMINNPDLLTHRELDFEGAGLTTLPSCVGLFEELQELILDDNFLVEVPPEIGECTELWRFQANQNAFSEPTSITPLLACQKLVELSLCTNGIKQFPTIKATRWTLLRRLDLTGNLLSQFPEGIGHCPELRTLRVYNNRITCIPDELARCTKLKVLSVAYNQLTVVNPVIGKLTRLRTLRLDRNQIKALPSEMSGCTRLTKLDLSHNPLEMTRAKILALVPTVNDAGLETSVTRALSLTASQQAQLSEPQDEEGSGAGSGSGSAEGGAKRQRTEEQKSR